MTNGAYIALWIILALLVAVLIINVFLAFRPNRITEVVNPVIPCQTPLSELPSVDNPRFLPCRDVQGDLDQNRYYDSQLDLTVLVIDPLVAPSALQVCAGLCEQLQLPNECLQATPAYTACLDATLPVGCNDPSRPVAHLNNRYLYSIGPGRTSCF